VHRAYHLFTTVIHNGAPWLLGRGLPEMLPHAGCPMCRALPACICCMPA
jgi:hypothetical protein